MVVFFSDFFPFGPNSIYLSDGDTIPLQTFYYFNGKRVWVNSEMFLHVQINKYFDEYYNATEGAMVNTQLLRQRFHYSNWEGIDEIYRYIDSNDLTSYDVFYFYQNFQDHVVSTLSINTFDVQMTMPQISNLVSNIKKITNNQGGSSIRYVESSIAFKAINNNTTKYLPDVFKDNTTTVPLNVGCCQDVGGDL